MEAFNEFCCIKSTYYKKNHYMYITSSSLTVVLNFFKIKMAVLYVSFWLVLRLRCHTLLYNQTAVFSLTNSIVWYRYLLWNCRQNKWDWELFFPLSDDILSANERFGWKSLDLISGICNLRSAGFSPMAVMKKHDSAIKN